MRSPPLDFPVDVYLYLNGSNCIVLGRSGLMKTSSPVKHQFHINANCLRFRQSYNLLFFVPFFIVKNA